ncbi:MAG: hypothetical protein WCO25_05105 [Candidatus Uhrbacteria bacterium]
MAIESKMRRPTAFGQPAETGTPKKRIPWLAVSLVAIVIAASAFAWWWFRMRAVVPAGLSTDAAATVPSGAYQAVFLDNGQVYFGKLETRKGEFYRLSNVYYMQLQGNTQAAADSVLVKLGSEVHGPADFMDINPAHILFTEDLTGDSKVAKAIADYVSKRQAKP